MKRKGYNVRPIRHLIFRDGNPETDVDAFGVPIHSGYAVPVRVADCKPRPAANGDIYFDKADIEAAPCLPNLIFTRTNMAHGPWRHQTRGKYVWRRLDRLPEDVQATARRQAEDEPGLIRNNHVMWYAAQYWTRPVYWIENGRVYRGVAYAYENPNTEEKS